MFFEPSWFALEGEQGEIGFLSGNRRINECMTCARLKLLLVSDSSTLCSQPFFVELLAYVRGVEGYRIALDMVKKSVKQ